MGRVEGRSVPGDNGVVRIGEKGKRGLTKVLNGFMSYRFTISTPREAKCCQSWIDCVVDPDNVAERFTYKKIDVIKRMHAILNGLRLLRCVVCHREAPGYDFSFQELKVLEC